MNNKSNMNLWQVMWESGLKDVTHIAWNTTRAILQVVLVVNTMLVVCIGAVAWFDPGAPSPVHTFMKINVICIAGFWIGVGMIRLCRWIYKCWRKLKATRANRLTHLVGQKCNNKECMICQ